MSQFITLAEGKVMTSQYRTNRNDMLQPDFQNRNILSVCETFSSAQVLDLLKQHNCEKLRIYFGMDNDQLVHAILVAVDENDADILTPGNEMLLDRGTRCPDECPPNSPLNS